jgi:PEP-CTERM motif
MKVDFVATCFGAALAFALAAQPAKAVEYQYTFYTSSFGAIEFTTPSLIPPDITGISISSFTQGSADTSISFTQDLSFGFIDGSTSTEPSFMEYIFAFPAFPAAAGVYDTGDDPGYVFFLSHTDISYTSGTLTIAVVPEPSTWAMMLLGFAGLGFAGCRQRQRGEDVFI